MSTDVADDDDESVETEEFVLWEEDVEWWKIRIAMDNWKHLEKRIGQVDGTMWGWEWKQHVTSSLRINNPQGRCVSSTVH